MRACRWCRFEQPKPAQHEQLRCKIGFFAPERGLSECLECDWMGYADTIGATEYAWHTALYPYGQHLKCLLESYRNRDKDHSRRATPRAWCHHARKIAAKPRQPGSRGELERV